MYGRSELLEVLRRAKTLVSRTGNRFGWSRWNDADDAIREIDFKISLIGTQPEPDPFVVADLFVWTGPMEDLSIASGWVDDFEDLAQQFESVAQQVRRNRMPIRLQRSQPGAGPAPCSTGEGVRPGYRLVVQYTPGQGTDPHNTPDR
jgi:hypothetical protein